MTDTLGQFAKATPADATPLLAYTWQFFLRTPEIFYRLSQRT
jgi:hypothetical protein